MSPQRLVRPAAPPSSETGIERDHLERLVRLFARTCFLWTLLTEARILLPSAAAFIGVGGSSSREAIPSTASIFLLSAINLKLSPTKLKKRDAIAFCASSPSRAA
jgi:hypothetical protein